MNPHALAGTSPSSWRVCQFRHFDLGRDKLAHAPRANDLSTVPPVTRWFSRHRGALEGDLGPGEQLLDADRVRVSRPRRSPRSLPRGGFILGVTDRRIAMWTASTWLARPEALAISWSYDEGIVLARAPLGRLRLLLPDRTIVTLNSYGSWSIRHLAGAARRP